MNSTMTTIRSRHENPPEQARVHDLRPVRRVSTLDRLALHVGLALITYGRRTLHQESRERRANRVELRLAHLERERDSERMLRLTMPVR
ncbi:MULTISPECIES: hypothetical protein [unclassified Cryobacterium]|uniref:hypothetical protein n=1 Tax=unclassified Cryobacterium TaxID=2649013 RepID=UPI0014450E11|nr:MULTISPECIES: hypothetical protein [unclassified Cryobacterium]